jgi:predicted small lipoprotein YifL
MRLHLRSTLLSAITLAALLTLAACGKSGQPASNPPAAGTAAAPAQPSSAPATPAPATNGSAAAPAASGSAPAPAGSAPAAPQASAAPTAAAPAAAADAFKVASLTVGDAVNAEHKVRKAVDRFAPTQKTLYASVATEGDTDGATLNATWRYLEGKGQLVSSISQRVATHGPATTTFKVENPNLWPEGKYSVEISLDGKQVTSQSFEVKKR